MKSILNLLQDLAEADLYVLSEAVDLELQRREVLSGDFQESARRRANERGQSYRHRVGAGAPPVRIVGLRKPGKRDAA